MTTPQTIYRHDAQGNRIAETAKAVPESVTKSVFGCTNCLYAGCECVRGLRYTPATTLGKPSCTGYVYFD